MLSCMGQTTKATARDAEIPKQNGSAVRDFRQKAGLSREELGEQSRITYSHVANIENEHKDASLEVLYRVASVLAVDIRSILRNPPANGSKAVAS